MTKCRICKKEVKKILYFGKLALAGNFLKKNQIPKEKKYDLTLTICKSCSHVQIKEKINPNLLFKKYLWETRISKTNLKLIKDLDKNLSKISKIKGKSKILEIASNDGSLLSYFKSRYKLEVLGVDPAMNLAKKANKQGIKTLPKYFSSKCANLIKKKFGKYNFIFARNVIAHVIDPNEIFKGAKKVLKEKGFFIVEFPSLLNIYKYLQYDNVFHEHVGFHSLKSINDLSLKNDLKVVDIDIVPSQGGSLRCYITHRENDIKQKSKVKNYFYKEKKLKLFAIESWKNFAKKVSLHKSKLKNLIKKLINENKSISIYGASGKGQALMQYSGLNNKMIKRVYDLSKLKINKFTPGTHIRIDHPRKINRNNIDYLLICTWNLAPEIIEQQKKYDMRGGKFIIPFPNPKIL